VPQPQPSPVIIPPEVTFPAAQKPFQITPPSYTNEGQPYCEVLSCYGNPVKINQNLKGASLEEAPSQTDGTMPWQILLMYMLFVVALLLAPYYDQRVARMLKAKLATTKPSRKKSSNR
jgi:hypothetical protein